MFKKYFPILAISVLFLADRVSKITLVRFLPENRSIPVIDGVFHLTHVDNTGAAFGLFRGARFFLVLVTLISVSFLFFFLARGWNQARSLQRWGWVLVIGGALGNLYDRVLYQHVIDFLDFRVWPVFNLADTFVCVGVGLVILSAVRK